MINATVTQMANMLENLSAILKKAEAHAEATEGLEIESLLNARLSEDMFHFIRQIQAAADTAKYTAARLSGRDAPRDEDNETSAAEVHARLAATVEFLRGFSEDDFTGALENKVVLPFAQDMFMSGQDYLMQFAIPNFYFHVTTAYGLLRHHGVAIGKRDFLGRINLKPST